MTKKVKCSTCSKGWCKNHIFEFTASTNKDSVMPNMKRRLCPRYNPNSSSFCKEIPVVNRDGKTYTPLFLYEDQKEFYERNGEKVMKTHLQNLNQNLSGMSQLFVPKAISKENYCSVCQEKYGDYLSHINEFEHKRKVNGNRFTAYTREMQCRYRKLRTKQLLVKIEEPHFEVDEEQWSQNTGDNISGLLDLLKSPQSETF